MGRAQRRLGDNLNDRGWPDSLGCKPDWRGNATDVDDILGIHGDHDLDRCSLHYGHDDYRKYVELAEQPDRT